MNIMEWIVKRRRKTETKKNCDVVVTTTKAQTSITGKQVNFIFKRNSENLITKTGYVSVAYYRCRIYFREATKEEGFRVTSQQHSIGITTSDVLISWAEVNKGDYLLQYDEREQLYYIEAKEWIIKRGAPNE